MKTCCRFMRGLCRGALTGNIPVLCLSMLVLIAVSSSIWGQTTGTATMLGLVTDSTGSVVPAARVTVTNLGTNFVSTSVTTSEGTWYIPSLMPGMYQLKIEAAGFKNYVREGIQLRTAESPRFDVALEVGAVNESIQVTGAAPLLETETATSG